MKKFPDKYFDLAIVDPPYGHKKWKKNNSMGSSRILKYGNTTFNLFPINKKYIIELKRISKNQILFGANYYPQLLDSSQGWLFWYKHQPVDNFADGEFIYTSFDIPAKLFNYPYYGNINKDSDNRIHPTQKPIQLYKWLLNKYAEPSFKIIDTHAGSCSSVIAFLDFGCDWIAFEIDEDYYRDALKRIENHKAQLKLF